MEIKPPNIPLPNLTVGNIKPALEQWRAGQILEATVIAKPKADAFTLKIGANTLQATGAPPQAWGEPIEPGVKLRLQVVQTLPQLLLKVLANTPPPPPIANDALKQQLPKQAPLPPLLANLAALTSKAPSSPPPSLPPAVSAAINHLVSQLPTPPQLNKGDAETMKRLIKESGVFLERSLNQLTPTATQNDSLNRDFKANLLKVLQQLQNYQAATKEMPQPQTASSAKQTPQLPAALAPRPATPPLPSPASPPPTTETLAKPAAPPMTTPLPPLSTPPESSLPPLKTAPLQAQAPSQATVSANMPLNQIIEELSQQIDSALSRLRVTQLSNLPVDNSVQQNWTVELPLRRPDSGVIDLVHMRIEEEEQGGNQDEKKTKLWRVTLAFDFAELGAMYANIALVERKISTTFHAEQAQTATLIDENLKVLTKTLTDAGLTIDTLACHQGKPVGRVKTRLTQTLLDIKA